MICCWLLRRAASAAAVWVWATVTCDQMVRIGTWWWDCEKWINNKSGFHCVCWASAAATIQGRRKATTRQHRLTWICWKHSFTRWSWRSEQTAASCHSCNNGVLNALSFSRIALCAGRSAGVDTPRLEASVSCSVGLYLSLYSLAEGILHSWKRIHLTECCVFPAQQQCLILISYWKLNTSRRKIMISRCMFNLISASLNEINEMVHTTNWVKNVSFVRISYGDDERWEIYGIVGRMEGHLVMCKLCSWCALTRFVPRTREKLSLAFASFYCSNCKDTPSKKEITFRLTCVL